MSVLIALNGRRGAGKDTAFSFIQEWANERGVSAHRRGFADALKQSFARMWIPDISVEEAINWCDELKADSLLTISWGRVDSFGTYSEVTHKISGRQALQRYGTEGHRHVFDDDFWVDVLLPMARTAPWEYDTESWALNFRGPLAADPPEICVITDCRFPNEAMRVKALDSEIWEISRPALEEEDLHPSEAPLPPELIDQTLVNIENDLGVLREQVFSQMNRYYDGH